MSKTQNQQINTQNLLPRPPIVVILGHVDHGKTTLLDYIRKTNVVAKEAGGITQSIGAYEIIHVPHESQTDADYTQTNAEKSPRGSAPVEGKKITFIDTPGHEAFSKMRQRGAKVADLGILVVAADEGVKPQTREAIEILKESQTPFIVAINKIDKPNANIEKVKQELMQAGVLLEGFGGSVSWQPISAKTGEGVNELLDLILLAAELEGLTYDPNSKASGVIIESKMDNRRGLTVVAIVKNGVLKLGDEVATSTAFGKIKILENFLGERVNELSPSSPALIIGFETIPQIGEEFFCGKVELVEIKPTNQQIREISVYDRDDLKVNFIIKADVFGSLEAISEIIKTISNINIINQAIGDINDGDVKLALNTNAMIVGFKTKVSKAAENLAKSQNIKIITSEIIYDLLKQIEQEIEKFKEPEINGQLEVLAVFGKKTGRRQVVGGRVLAGIFKNNLSVKIQRQEQVIGQGKILNLKKGKQDTNQVDEGEECGILLETDILVNVGDHLIY
jgi:translation initiation factor IF-2